MRDVAIVGIGHTVFGNLSDFDLVDVMGYASLDAITDAGIESNRDAIEQACESAGEKNLYFPSALGEDDDRYYKVYTQPARFSPHGATVYQYSFECVCADAAVYLTADDTAVW